MDVVVILSIFIETEEASGYRCRSYKGFIIGTEFCTSVWEVLQAMD